MLDSVGLCMTLHGAAWCNMVQDGASWCSMLQYGAWCSMVQHVAVAAWYSMLQLGKACCSLVQHGSTWCRMMQHGAELCNMVHHSTPTLIQRKKENSDSSEKGDFECGPAQPSLSISLSEVSHLLKLTLIPDDRAFSLWSSCPQDSLPHALALKVLT